ncbi:MAG: hypothetical protein IKZ44_07780 [Clostridia bacterium]|nr:hypothetical protein [Clostridia bacterium]
MPFRRDPFHVCVTDLPPAQRASRFDDFPDSLLRRFRDRRCRSSFVDLPRIFAQHRKAPGGKHAFRVPHAKDPSKDFIMEAAMGRQENVQVFFLPELQTKDTRTEA